MANFTFLRLFPIFGKIQEFLTGEINSREKWFPYAKWLVLIGIPLVSLLMHWRVFNLELMSAHVWRQSQTQSNIINFAEGDMNILNPKRNRTEGGDGIYRREFPLMQWSYAWFYRAFGNHIFISRFLTWLIGLAGVLGMYFLGKWAFRDALPGLIAAWAFNFSPEFFYYTVNPLPDILALVAGIWGMAFFFKWRNSRALPHLIGMGLALSLATLIKLPFLVYFALPFGQVLLDIRAKKPARDWLKTSLIQAVGLIPPLAWYAWVIPQWPKEGLVEGVFASDTGAQGLLHILAGNLFSSLPEMLLNYAAVPLFLAGWVFAFKGKKYRSSGFLPFALSAAGVLAYFFYEMNMIGTVHDYYLFPFIPYLFLLVALGGWKLWQQRNPVLKYLPVLALLIVPLTCHLRMANRWNPQKPGYNPDLLVYQQELRQAVPKDALVIAGNDLSQFILLYMLDKKGWVFDKEALSEAKLKRALASGVEYMYSDSRQVEKDSRINKYFEEMILEAGTFKVFRLKSE